MKTVHVEIAIRAPIDAVFAAISDHARYDELPGVSKAQLLVEGTPDRNGVGALRFLKASGVSFEEEIVAYEAPKHFAYMIRKCTLPIVHEGGRMDFTTTPSGTHVRWETTYRLRIPLIGGVATTIAATPLRRSFNGMLAAFKETLERSAAT